MKNLITCLIVSVLCATSSTSAQRTLPVKPDRAVIPAGYYKHQIYVRMHEGINAEMTIASMSNQRSESGIPEIAGATWKMVAAGMDYKTIGEKLQRAEQRLGRDIADPRQGLHIQLPEDLSATAAIDALNKSPLIEIALPVPIPQVAFFGTPNYQGSQGYENPAATGGVGAELVWSEYDIHGEGVQVCDIEWAVNTEHCDLPNVEYIGIPPTFDDDHGTAVVGVMASLNDGVGTTGIAYGVDAVKFASYYTMNFDTALYQAVILGVPSGSIILLEIHIAGPNWDGSSTYGYVPVEWYEPYYDAVLYAVGNDMIVCEAAGNGYQDLDASVYSQGNGGHYPFLPENDSGAIMIGAGGAYGTCGYPEGWKQRLSYSNYGSRVDVQGWGECVVTTGYGYLWDEPDCDYTNSFNGTSSATPIVAGACLLIQSYAVRDLGGPLLPEEMRSLLIDTGQPQVSPSTGHIGPLPDAYAAINSYIPTGACCNANGACVVAWEEQCVSLGAIWMGPGTVCEDGICDKTPCEGDADSSGAVDVGDLLAVIDQWGSDDSAADINGDGIVNVNDLLAVVGNWGPCE